MRRVLVVVAAMLMFMGTAEARRRPTPSVPFMEIEGKIKSISATEIVVTTEGKGDVTVKITTDTIFRRGDMAIDPGTLKIGDQVHIRATVKDNVATAVLVKLQNENEEQRPEQLEVEGVIKSVTPDFVVTDARGHDTTFKITADTVIRKGEKAVTIGDLAIGDRVHVKATVDAGVNTALLIIVQAPEGQNENAEVSGVIAEVAADHLKVTPRIGNITTIQVDNNTRIKRGDRTIQLSDLKVGDSIKAEGTLVNATTILARQIEAGKGD